MANLSTAEHLQMGLSAMMKSESPMEMCPWSSGPKPLWALNVITPKSQGCVSSQEKEEWINHIQK